MTKTRIKRSLHRKKKFMVELDANDVQKDGIKYVHENMRFELYKRVYRINI
jgi:hypothetical protein